MIWYRITMKGGIRRFWFKQQEFNTDSIFFREVPTRKNYPNEWLEPLLEHAQNIIKGKLRYYAHHWQQVGNPPNWFLNPFNGREYPNIDQHWTALPDFHPAVGDIKHVWEGSRFEWTTTLARAYAVTGEPVYLETLNNWLADWLAHNPLNTGPHWKCGQENSIRLFALMNSALVLNQHHSLSEALLSWVYLMLNRINANIRYAIAQDNNHGTSEAAALYVGATWLLNQKKSSFDNHKSLKRWQKKGRRLLENRLLKLIATHGTFSQKSVTYHRVVVDTISWTLFAMEQFGEPAFSGKINSCLRRLGEWQYKVIACDNGDVPNMGSNDGAMFENLHHCNYRDFRPSTQLYFAVLYQKRIFGTGSHDEPLYWRYPDTFSNFPQKEMNIPAAEILDQNLLIITKQNLKLFLKIPEDSFRPSGNDAFHLDFWLDGVNVLRDAGTYSYNAGQQTEWFKSVKAHNTLQFGNSEQMPKLSRFLYGNWTKLREQKPLMVDDEAIAWSGSYVDFRGNTHQRSIDLDLTSRTLTVSDKVHAIYEEPVSLYWHCHPSYNQKIDLVCKDFEENVLDAEEIHAWFSPYYQQKESSLCYHFSTKSGGFETIINF